MIVRYLPALQKILESTTTPFRDVANKFRDRHSKMLRDAPKSYKENNEKVLNDLAREAEKLASTTDEAETALDLKNKAKAFGMAAYKDRSNRRTLR